MHSLTEFVAWLLLWAIWCFFAWYAWMDLKEIATRDAVNYLIDRAKKTPFWHLTGYMERYWLVPMIPVKPGTSRSKLVDGEDGITFCKFRERPIGWLLQKWGKSVRVHHILRSDREPDMHDHPGAFVTIILRGSYREHRPVYDLWGRYVCTDITRHGPGSILFRRHTDLHRLEVDAGETVWTCFIMGKWRHRWGFVPDLATGVKIPYNIYLKLDTLHHAP